MIIIFPLPFVRTAAADSATLLWLYQKEAVTIIVSGDISKDSSGWFISKDSGGFISKDSGWYISKDIVWFISKDIDSLVRTLIH